jgi:hypothetical protein
MLKSLPGDKSKYIDIWDEHLLISRVFLSFLEWDTLRFQVEVKKLVSSLYHRITWHIL